MAYFSSNQLDHFAAGYPNTPTTFRHNLEDHPLLKVERLAQLANSLPEDQLEYNLGAIDIDQSDWKNTPGTGLSVEDTLQNINVSGSWVALRNIESDTQYKELMMACLEPVFPAVEALRGKAYRPEGFIFVSSPDAITPFHFDPEHNILMQIRGEKAMTVFPSAHERIVSPEQHETYHLGGHCNLEYADEMAAHGKTFSLTPGDALYVPVKAPHWVRNGKEVSISLSVTWRSEASERVRRIYLINAKLRRLGMKPGLADKNKKKDLVKNLTGKVLSRVGVL